MTYVAAQSDSVLVEFESDMPNVYVTDNLEEAQGWARTERDRTKLNHSVFKLVEVAVYVR